MNFVLFFYNTRPAWINRDGGSTRAIYTPNSPIVKMTEGISFRKSDSRGYVNDTDKLADNYIIAIGASHTQGKEVLDGQRYTDLLNDWLGYDDTALVYNVSEDGYFLPYVLKGFTAVTQEFPDAQKIIIEIGSTSYPIETFKDAYEQRSFDKTTTGQDLFNSFSNTTKTKLYLKQYTPLYYNMKDKISTIKELNAQPSSTSDEAIDLEEYRSVLNNVMNIITTQYDKDIIFLYHPKTELTESGDLSILENDTDSIFKDVCSSYSNITVVDMGEHFSQEYEAYNYVPYGFSNTTMATGHLNKEGHRMIAEELLKIIQ